MFVLLQKTLDGAFPRMPLFKVSRFSREWKFGGKDSVLPRDHVQIPNCPKIKACRRLAIGNSHENFNCTDIAKVASSKDLSPRRRSGSKRGTCLAAAGCTAACCMTGRNMKMERVGAGKSIVLVSSRLDVRTLIGA